MRRDLLVGVACFCGALASASPSRGEDAGWLRIDAPAALDSTAQLPLVEVRGRAAARGARIQEVVIALDVSASSVLPSGWDVDGDGAHGRTDPALLARLLARPDLPAGLGERLRADDFDDSVLAAELEATRALLARLEKGTQYRVGLVAFSDAARVIAPVGSSPQVLSAALDALRENFVRDLHGTNFGDAISTAQRALQPETTNGVAAGAPAGTEQSILLLSDGVPTYPPYGDMARQHALFAATAAGAAGIRVSTFELSRSPSAKNNVLAEIAERSGGRFEALERPGDAIARLRRTDLAGLAELHVVNETTGAPVRALRTFPDGSFDGFVELAPGRNRIVFRATTTAGASAVAERWVVRSNAAATTPEEARTRNTEAAALLAELRRRTRETELWAEMERGRTVQSRELELRVAPEPAPEPER